MKLFNNKSNIMKNNTTIWLLMFFILNSINTIAIIPDSLQTEKDEKQFKFESQMFVGYQYIESPDGYFNEFKLKRGYLTSKITLNKFFSARITSDITQDREGDGLGDMEMRFKYAYLKANLPNLAFLNKTHIEFGIIHTPWMDFEQSINKYRVEGKMFSDRWGLVNSADFGIMFVSLLGGEMDNEYKDNINRKNAGKYGSIAIGVFNGGGYHALENNRNKTIESRFTLRPFSSILPGLQLSYHNVYGKGNIRSEPDLMINMGMISFESKIVVLTAQYVQGTGSPDGDFIEYGKSYNLNGYSIFGEFKIPNTQFALFSRYDYLNSKTVNNEKIEVIICGLSYFITRKSKVLIDFDQVREIGMNDIPHRTFEFAIEIAF